MSEKRTELQRMDILRLSNIESNRLTKECIESALVLLMEEKTFNEITITDIVKRAGVSRTAYYRNYSSKEDILNSMVKDFVHKVVSAMSKYDPSENLYEFFFQMFQGLRPFSDTYKILLKANFGETILTLIIERLNEDNKDGDTKLQYSNSFWSGAVYAILTEWIRSDLQQTEDEMATICCTIVKSVNQ